MTHYRLAITTPTTVNRETLFAVVRNVIPDAQDMMLGVLSTDSVTVTGTGAGFVPQGDSGFDWDLLNAVADRTRATSTLTPRLMEQFRPVLLAAGTAGPTTDRMIRNPEQWFDGIPAAFARYRNAHSQVTVPQGDNRPDVAARLLALDKIAALLGAQYEWDDAEENLAIIATWITDAGLLNPGHNDSLDHYQAEANRLGVSF